MKNVVTAEEARKHDVPAEISSAQQVTMERLKSSRTASLRLQYMEMINVLCKFIRREHTGN